MIRKALIAALSLCLLALPALAAPKPLGTDDIRALLAGSTVHDTWAGTGYFSYFEANGWTTYVEPGKPPSQGRWQAEGARYPSTVLPGDRLPR
jgi:hypothetical protein